MADNQPTSRDNILITLHCIALHKWMFKLS